MRRAVILAVFLGCAAQQALAAPRAGPPTPANADALAAAAFAPGAGPASDDPIGRLLDRDAPPAQWAFGRERFGLPAQGGEMNLMRHWPGAVSFGAGPVAVDVSPHAGLGYDALTGGSAEAGATVQLSKADLAGERLKAMGVRDGAEFGNRGRWYLFAAASGRAVGLNMLQGEAGGWNRAGWSTDPASKLIGDTQIGVGWRKGALQTSVGFVHREVKGQHMMQGVDPHADSMVAFSLSVKPRP